jgi:hypothetical protein
MNFPPPSAAARPAAGPKSGPAGPGAVRPSGATGPAPTPVERIGFYDAIERIYEAPTVELIGRLVGSALLTYFERVLVLSATAAARRWDVVGYAGLTPSRSAVAAEALTEIGKRRGNASMTYGPADADSRPSELCDLFGVEEGRTALIAPVDAHGESRLVLFADNGKRPELYEDLHDIEVLLKEAETAVGMLLSKPIPVPAN